MFSGKTFFAGFQLTVFENKNTFMKKKLYCIQSLWCTRHARQVLRNLFSTSQGNDSEIIFVAGAIKINLQNLKT